MPESSKVPMMGPKSAAGPNRRIGRPLLTFQSWRDAIRNHAARVGVVGMGYVGLPLMRTFCSAGFSCLGFDVDEVKVAQLNAGKSYIKHIP